MTILCGTNFSELSKEAADAAAAIAARVDEPVELVHVIAKHASPVEQQLLRIRLDEEAERLGKRFHLRVTPRAPLGDAADVLTQLVAELKPRLLVLSSRGASRPDHWLHGSVAEDVAAASKIPALVVRDSLAILQWTLGERPLSVMVGVGLDATSKVALSWAAALREIAPCNLLVTQIVWPFGESDRLSLEAGVDPDRLRPGLAQVLDRELREWAGEVPGAGVTTFCVRPGWGRVDTHLTQRASAEGVDLLVVGTHRRVGFARLWHGSTSSGAIHYAACNVACIPAATTAATEPSIHGFRSVLVPTDFSPDSNRAIASAYGMLRPGGVAHLLHVVTAAEQHETADPRQLLRELVPPAARGKGIETRVHVVFENRPSNAIVATAARLGVDAICMATRSRSAAAELALGSEAREVLSLARRPLLLIAPEFGR
jgi:nucleotide-binding universal stress UspA family protein